MLPKSIKNPFQLKISLFLIWNVQMQRLQILQVPRIPQIPTTEVLNDFQLSQKIGSESPLCPVAARAAVRSAHNQAKLFTTRTALVASGGLFATQVVTLPRHNELTVSLTLAYQDSSVTDRCSCLEVCYSSFSRPCLVLRSDEWSRCSFSVAA